MSQPHYVIVGAGTAGPVIAARLSEDPSVEVVLLEAGKENTNDVGRSQGAFFVMFGSEADWNYATTAQPGIGGRAITHPRGKVVGGSCALNVGAWLRGVPGDYDNWAKEGATGWNGDEAVRTYKRIENSDRGPSPSRGSGGPVTVEDLPSPTNLPDVMMTGFTEAGFGPRGDSNGETPFVADRYQTTFAARTRRTPADAYLTAEARARPNLRIITEAFVTRIVFDGTRAVGVRYEKDGAEHQLGVQGEVILSAGVINTPQLLMLSGVAPYTEVVHPAIGAPDAELEAAIRKGMFTTFRLVGTARMGSATDPGAVVDPELRVRGVKGLRVADASVIPSLISGHTIAPSVFIGERAAELIRNG